MPGVGLKAIVAHARQSVLVVGHADVRAGTVPVEPDGMTVDDGRQLLRLALRERRGQRGVAGRASPGVREHDVLQTPTPPLPIAQSGRRFDLTVLQDVGVVLRVCREAEIDDPEVAVQEVAALDDAAVWRAPALPLQVHRRLEPLPESEFGHPLPHPPRHVVGRGDTGRDHGRGKRLADDGVRDGHRLTIGRRFLRELALEPVHRERLGRRQPSGVLGPERGHEGVVLGVRQAVGVRERPRRVDGDRPGRRSSIRARRPAH